MDSNKRCRRDRWLTTLMIGLPVTVIVFLGLFVLGCREWWGYVIQIVWLLIMWAVAFWRGREAERDCLWLKALTEKFKGGRVEIKVHHIEWTEDQRLNGYLLLTTVPVGEAVAMLPYKSLHPTVYIHMPCADPRILAKVSEVTTEDFFVGCFARRCVVNEHGEDTHVWVRIT